MMTESFYLKGIGSQNHYKKNMVTKWPQQHRMTITLWKTRNLRLESGLRETSPTRKKWRNGYLDRLTETSKVKKILQDSRFCDFGFNERTGRAKFSAMCQCVSYNQLVKGSYWLRSMPHSQSFRNPAAPGPPISPPSAKTCVCTTERPTLI